MATLQEITMQDAPASVDTTYTISVGDVFEGVVEDHSDEDWVRVELVAGRSYDIRLEGVGADGLTDSILRIYNSAGEEVAFNDDIDSGARIVNSMLEFTPDTTGVYYIGAGGYQSLSQVYSGRYRVTVSDEDDNADTPYTISPGGRFNGTFDSNTDRDWIRVELSEGKTYNITLGGIGPDVDMDTVLRVYNSAGEQVGINDDVDHATGKLNSSLAFSPVATGTYYISAGAYAGNPTQDHSGRYQVTVHDEEERNGLTVAGTEGNDDYFNGLVGGPGDDELNAGEGDDWLEGGPGADQLRGGPGEDTARYLYSDAGVEVNLQEMTARGGHAEGDTFEAVTVIVPNADGETDTRRYTDIENLFGSAYDDILIGNFDNNSLGGYHGNDRLDGRAGHDSLYGGPGADVLIGGEGSDTVSYFSSEAGVEVRLSDGTARGGDAEGDTFPGRQSVEYLDAEGTPRVAEVSDIENLAGSQYDDILVGTPGDNLLVGFRGNDELYGGFGDDFLFGEPGADELDGGYGNDLLFGGPGADELDGGYGNDFLFGEPGADELDGGMSEDYLSGGEGADTLIGGGGSDIVAYVNSDEGVVVRLHNGTARGGHADGDTFAGTETVEHTDSDSNTMAREVTDIEHLYGSQYDDILAGDLKDNRIDGFGGNDVLYGGPLGGDDQLFGYGGNDRLYGGIGNDLLGGGDDNDRLHGGLGNDSMIGDGGDDIFYFAPGGGADTVRDFGNGEDKIDLTAFADIRSMEDLVMTQQGDVLVIDLSGQGGGTVELWNITEAELTDSHFIF